MTSHATTAATWVADDDTYWGGIDAAVRSAGLDAPVVALDTTALAHNIRDLRRRARGVPIRVASKSLRVRSVLDQVLADEGFSGVLAYDLAEAHWLATASGVRDVLMGYPTVRRAALEQFLRDEVATDRVTLLIDSTDQLDLIDAVMPPAERPTVRIAIDVDASLRLFGGRLHLGVRRSPLHDAAQTVQLARATVARPGFALVGVMSYEAQVAGVGNGVEGQHLQSAVVRALQRASINELRERRAVIIGRLRDLTELQIVNVGGTGSLESSSVEPYVTDIAAGSGLFGGHLFDNYRHFQPAPALSFGLDVVRKPAPGLVTCAGGGWVAYPGPIGCPHRSGRAG